MSVGTNHVVTLFTPKSAPLDDTQRLAVITRKNTAKTVAENGGKELQSQCVSVPQISVTDEQLLSMRSLVVEYLEDMQDGLIRSLVDGGASSINDSQIGFNEVISYTIAQNAGKRIKKESIIEWWNTTVYPEFRAYSEIKFGIDGVTPATEAQVLRLEQTCNAWRDSMATVAGKSLLSLDKIAQLSGVIKKLELNDAMARKVSAKLAAMKAEHEKLAEALPDLDFTTEE